MNPAVVGAYLVGAYLLGSVPFSYFVARATSGLDLRRVGSGTVSGTGVHLTSGFWPMALAGVLDIGKGAAAVAPVAGSHPVVAAFGAGAVAIGHNWSLFLRGAGGRAVSVALGVTLVAAWPGTVVVALGMALGRLANNTGIGCFVALCCLPLVLGLAYGGNGLLLAGALVLPIWAKRVMGNTPAPRPRSQAYLSRLVRDRDP